MREPIFFFLERGKSHFLNLQFNALRLPFHWGGGGREALKCPKLPTRALLTSGAEANNMPHSPVLTPVLFTAYPRPVINYILSDEGI